MRRTICDMCGEATESEAEREQWRPVYRDDGMLCGWHCKTCRHDTDYHEDQGDLFDDRQEASG